jgi:putative endonuclease
MAFYVYILASQRNGTLYIGYTDDLSRRMIEHKEGTFRGFAWKYGVSLLVYYEQHESRDSAWRRERAMKKWNRAWKIELIERLNPAWADLSDSFEQ